MPKTTTKFLKTKKTFTEKQKQALKKATKKQGPVWKGPEEEGVTQSLLGSFLCCRERFRLKVVDGLTEADNFRHSLEYGNMWHACEEALAAGDDPGNKIDQWAPLKDYCNELLTKYPLAKDQILKWYEVCKLQFPIYVNYWRKHPDVKARTPLLQEETFCVPYELPSGRIVKLRGKFDSVDLIGKAKKAGIWLQENKTKGEIKEEQLVRQLTFDLQTMFYLIALGEYRDTCLQDAPSDPGYAKEWEPSIKGIRYNVIRRPLAGGKGSIRPHKATKTKPAETMSHYYDRLRVIIEEEPEYYFMRWQVVITPADIERFKRECLNPILESLCDWWDAVTGFPTDPWGSDHFRMPYGLYSPLALGYTTELDEYLASGSTVGLEKTDNLFPELD